MLNHRPITEKGQDHFNISPFVENFLERILEKNETEPSKGMDSQLVGIYARWGSGKTSSINLCYDLYEKKYKNVEGYYDVKWIGIYQTWATGCTKDYLVPVVYHVVEWFEKKIPPERRESEAFKKFLKAGARVLTAVGLVVTDGAGSLLGLGRLGTSAVNALKTVDEVLPVDPSYKRGTEWNEYRERVELKQAFAELVEVICEFHNKDCLILPIDDLDRCKPETAIGLLFSLKNLLVSDRICFLVAIDKSAIAKYLTCVYGQALSFEDSDWFLEKIFDDWVTVPECDYKNYTKVLVDSCEDEVLKKTLIDFLNNGFGKIIDNPRNFIRSLDRFMKFYKQILKRGEEVDEKLAQRLSLHLCWYIVYHNHYQVFELLLQVRGQGSMVNTFKVALEELEVARAYGKRNSISPLESEIKKAQSSQGHLKKAKQPSFTSQKIENLANDLESPLMTIIGLARLLYKEDSVDQLNESLVEAIEYL